MNIFDYIDFDFSECNAGSGDYYMYDVTVKESIPNTGIRKGRKYSRATYDLYKGLFEFQNDEGDPINTVKIDMQLSKV